jgi:hypothetical protein
MSISYKRLNLAYQHRKIILCKKTEVNSYLIFEYINHYYQI